MSEQTVKRKDGSTIVRYGPGKDRSVSRVVFLLRFTAAEFVAISDSNDNRARWFWAMATGSERVDAAELDVQAGINYLEGIGLLANGRAAQIINQLQAIINQ